MVQQLCASPKVYQVQVDLPENPLRNLNAYAIYSQGEWLVIDTGFNRGECRKALLGGMEELGLDWGRTSLFLTHLHSDHIGLVHEFSDRGCPVYMNGIDYEICTLPREQRWGGVERTFRLEGFPQDMLDRQDRENQGRAYAPRGSFPVTKVGDGTVLTVGDLKLICRHTPGHTPGHTALYLPEAGFLFSGDHILFSITSNISIWDGVPDSLADYLTSLVRLRELRVTRTFPAHRTWDGDLYQRIDQMIRHHRVRLDQVQSVVAQHPGADAYTIAGQLTWSARGLGWEAFPPHQKWFAMGETLAHLYYLVIRGAVERREQGGRVMYGAKSK